MPRETDVIYGMTAGHGVTIEVDEAVFGLLTYEQRPGEAYNDVVRRLLGMPPKDGAACDSRSVDLGFGRRGSWSAAMIV